MKFIFVCCSKCVHPWWVKTVLLYIYPPKLQKCRAHYNMRCSTPRQLNSLQCKYTYEGNSKSKVPYFIHTERIPALSWQAWVVSTYIHHHIAVAGKFAPERFPIKWQMNTKTCLGQSLMLLQHYEEHGEALLSRFYKRKDLVFHFTPDSKTESVTWKWK